MISEKDNFPAWVGLIDGVNDAKVRLAQLANDLHKPAFARGSAWVLGRRTSVANPPAAYTRDITVL